MGYLHINNTHHKSAQTIFQFKECYLLEKIDGTSANITVNRDFRDPSLFPGCVKLQRFRDEVLGGEQVLRDLATKIQDRFPDVCTVTVYGELYGAGIGKHGARYGSKIRFVVFDVALYPDPTDPNPVWLCVPEAEEVAKYLGLEFVPYVRGPCDVDTMDRERDLPSVQCVRNGVLPKVFGFNGMAVDLPAPRREGVVVRPLEEYTDKHGNRVIAKHKHPEDSETVKPRKPGVAPEVLTEAGAIAREWVTHIRVVEHVYPKLCVLCAPNTPTIPELIKAVTEDVLREGAGEFVDSREVRSAIARETARVHLAHLRATIGSRS